MSPTGTCLRPSRFALLKYRSDFYENQLAGPQDILLLIEVADTSLEMDRRVKIPIYARAGVTEVWIVDVNTRTIEVYREPSEGGYVRVQTMQKGDEVSPLAFAGLKLSLDSLFPD